MSTLYITQQDATLRKIDERLRVTVKKDVLLDVPMIKISQVVLYGRITVTAATVAALMERQIDLCYLTRHGKYLGRLQPEFSKNSLLRSAQYRAAFDPERCVQLARGFVLGKLLNMRTWLMRMNRKLDHPDIEKAVKRIKLACDGAKDACDIDRLRGHEGEGSAAYFSVFKHLLKHQNGGSLTERSSDTGESGTQISCPSPLNEQDAREPGRNSTVLRKDQDGVSSSAYCPPEKDQKWEFKKRVRRPPTDPVNSLLSFGYTLLTNDMFSAVNVVGFDPYVGYLHAKRYGRASLPLDLIEEFRPVIVDSVVISAINSEVLIHTDFREDMGGLIRLTDEGRKKFLMHYENRKQTEFKHPVLKQKMSYHRCFEQQARFLAKTLQGELDEYPPLLIK
jgi:CRISPR-associated protein Cas1